MVLLPCGRSVGDDEEYEDWESEVRSILRKDIQLDSANGERRLFHMAMGAFGIAPSKLTKDILSKV